MDLLSPIAHGGTGGLVVELALLGVLVALVIAAWRQTRRTDDEELDRPSE